MTNKLKMVLNLPCQEAFIGLLNITVPTCQIAGRLALDISRFQKMASSLQMRRRNHEMCLQPEYDPELLHSAESSSNQFDHQRRDSHEQGQSSNMAAALAGTGQPIPIHRNVDGNGVGANGAAGPATKEVAPSPRSTGYGIVGSPAEQSHQTMCSREDAPLRESQRKLCQMPRQKVEVVRRRGAMDRPGVPPSGSRCHCLLLQQHRASWTKLDAQLGL